MPVLLFMGLWCCLGPTGAAAQTRPGQSETVQKSTSRDRSRKSGETGNDSQEETGAAEFGAVSTSRLALPFKQAWQYLTDAEMAFRPSVDETRVYLPLEGGRIVCLDRHTGALFWSSDLGGTISGPVTIGPGNLFVASQKENKDQGGSTGLLRALDASTGLTIWERDYPRPFTSPLAVSGDRIYAGSADGALWALSASDGKLLWRAETQDVVRAEPLATPGAIYFGSDDGAVRGVDPGTGKEIWKFQTKGKILGRPAVDEKRIYFGSGDAYIYAVDLGDPKVKWRAQTGAAVQASPVIVESKILVGSYDNFLYALSESKGDKVWKRRFDDRIAAPVTIDGDALMITPLRGDHVAMFLINDGRRVNYYALEKGYQITAEPVYIQGMTYIPTDRGLVVTQAETLTPGQGPIPGKAGPATKPDSTGRPVHPILP